MADLTALRLQAERERADLLALQQQHATNAASVDEQVAGLKKAQIRARAEQDLSLWETAIGGHMKCLVDGDKVQFTISETRRTGRPILGWTHRARQEQTPWIDLDSIGQRNSPEHTMYAAAVTELLGGSFKVEYSAKGGKHTAVSQWEKWLIGDEVYVASYTISIVPG